MYHFSRKEPVDNVDNVDNSVKNFFEFPKKNVHAPNFGGSGKITGKKSYSQKYKVKKISTAIVFYRMLIRLWIMWIS